MHEYIIYDYADYLSRYRPFLSKATTLNTLMFLLEDYGSSEETLKSYIREVEEVDGFFFTLTLMRYEGNGRIVISFLFEEDQREDFVATASQLATILDQWHAARIQRPKYIVMTRDADGIVSIAPTNDQNDFSALCVGEVCTLIKLDRQGCS